MENIVEILEKALRKFKNWFKLNLKNLFPFICIIVSFVEIPILAACLNSNEGFLILMGALNIVVVVFLLNYFYTKCVK